MVEGEVTDWEPGSLGGDIETGGYLVLSVIVTESASVSASVTQSNVVEPEVPNIGGKVSSGATLKHFELCGKTTSRAVCMT